MVGAARGDALHVRPPRAVAGRGEQPVRAEPCELTLDLCDACFVQVDHPHAGTQAKQVQRREPARPPGASRAQRDCPAEALADCGPVERP